MNPSGGSPTKAARAYHYVLPVSRDLDRTFDQLRNLQNPRTSTNRSSAEMQLLNSEGKNLRSVFGRQNRPGPSHIGETPMHNESHRHDLWILAFLISGSPRQCILVLVRFILSATSDWASERGYLGSSEAHPAYCHNRRGVGLRLR